MSKTFLNLWAIRKFIQETTFRNSHSGRSDSSCCGRDPVKLSKISEISIFAWDWHWSLCFEEGWCCEESVSSFCNCLRHCDEERLGKCRFLWVILEMGALKSVMFFKFPY